MKGKTSELPDERPSPDGQQRPSLPEISAAMRLRRQAMASWRDDSAYNLDQQGRRLWERGDPAAARPYFERALAIFEARLGRDHPYTRMARENLAEASDE